jgi:hypothetical protein
MSMPPSKKRTIITPTGGINNARLPLWCCCGTETQSVTQISSFAPKQTVRFGVATTTGKMLVNS